MWWNARLLATLIRTIWSALSYRWRHSYNSITEQCKWFFIHPVCACATITTTNNIFILWSAFVFSGYGVLSLFSINFGLICLQSDFQKGPDTERAQSWTLFSDFNLMLSGHFERQNPKSWKLILAHIKWESEKRRKKCTPFGFDVVCCLLPLLCKQSSRFFYFISREKKNVAQENNKRSNTSTA